MKLLRFFWDHPALCAVSVAGIGLVFVMEAQVIAATPLVGWPLAIITVLSARATWQTERRISASLEAALAAELAAHEAMVSAYRRVSELQRAEIDAAIEGLNSRSS